MDDGYTFDAALKMFVVSYGCRAWA